MEFEKMKRKELQSLCKKHGIPANLTNAEMAIRLTRFLKGNGVSEEKKIEEVDEEEDDTQNIEKKKTKKVRFSPENETREYEISGFGRPTRRSGRRGSPVTLVGGKKKGRVSYEKNKTVDISSKVTRSRRGVADKEESDSSVMEEKVNRRGLRSGPIDRDYASASVVVKVEEEAVKGVRRSTRNVADSTDSEGVTVGGIGGVTRSNNQGNVNASLISGLDEVVGRKGSKRKSAVQGDGKVGIEGKEEVFKEKTGKRSRNVGLEVVTEVEGKEGLDAGDAVGKASLPAAAFPRRTRRKTTVFGENVARDESGTGEIAAMGNESKENVIGKGGGVTVKPRRSNRNAALQSLGAISNEMNGIGEGVGGVGQPGRSKRKTTVLHSTAATDKPGTGEGVGEVAQPGRSKRKTTVANSTAASDKPGVGEGVDEVGQPGRSKRKTTGLHSTAASDKLGPGEAVGKGKQPRKNVSGKGTNLTEMPRRLGRNASRLHSAATSDELNELADSVGNAEQESDKCETIEETETAAVVDELLVGKTLRQSTSPVLQSELAGSVEKQDSLPRVPGMMKETMRRSVSGKAPNVTDEPQRFRRSASRHCLAAASNETKEITEGIGKVGQQTEKSEAIQETEVDVIVADTPRRSLRHTFKSELVGSSAAVEKKQKSISIVQVMMKETTPTNISGKGAHLIDEPQKFTRSAFRQRLASTPDETNKITRSVGKVPEKDEKSEAVQGTESNVNELAGSSAAVRKKRQSFSREQHTVKETPTKNSGEGAYVTDEPKRSTRSASRQHLSAISDETNTVTGGIGKVRWQIDKSEAVQETEIDVVVANTPRRSPRQAFESDLVVSSAAVGKKQKSISRVPVVKKETTPAKLSGERASVTTEPQRARRSASKQHLSATSGGTNEITESVGKLGQRSRKCKTAWKMDTSVARKTPRRSARHTFKSDFFGSSAASGMKQEGTSRVPIVMKEATPRTVSPSTEETRLTMTEATGERNYLVSNSYNAVESSEKRGQSKRKSRGKIKVASVEVSALHSDIEIDSDNATNLEEILESAPSNSASPSTVEEGVKVSGKSLNVSGLLSDTGAEMGTAKKLEEILDSASHNLASASLEEKTSNFAGDSVAVNERNIVLMDVTGSGISDRSIEGGAESSQSLDINANLDDRCSADLKLMESDAKHFEAISLSNVLSSANRSDLPGGESLHLSAGSEKVQAGEEVASDKEGRDDIGNNSTEIERISIEEGRVCGLDRTEQDDTKEEITDERKASPALGSNTIVEEIEGMHHESDDANKHQNFSATTVALTPPRSVCTTPGVNDEHQQASGSKVHFSGGNLSVKNSKQLQDETATTANNQDLKDVLDGVLSDYMPEFLEKLEDEEVGISTVANSSSDEILCREDLGDCMVDERGINSDNMGGESFSLEALFEPRLSEKIHNSKEMVVDSNCSVDVVLDAPVSEDYNPVMDMVENQHMDGKSDVEQHEVEDKDTRCSVVAEPGDCGGSQKMVAQVNSIGNSCFTRTTVEEYNDTIMAINETVSDEVVEEELNSEQPDLPVSEGVIECASAGKPSDHVGGEEVSTSLTQSTKENECSEGKNVELNSPYPKSIENVGGIDDKETKFEVSDSSAKEAFVECIGDDLDGEGAVEVHEDYICFENEKAADKETMAVEIQQAENEGTSEPDGTVEVISDWKDGLSKMNDFDDMVSVPTDASTDFGGLDKRSDGGKEAEIQHEEKAVEPEFKDAETQLEAEAVELASVEENYAKTLDTNNFVDVTAADANEEVEKTEGKNTDNDTDKELDNVFLENTSSSDRDEPAFFTNWEVNLMYGNKEQAAVESDEEVVPLGDNLISNDSEKVKHEEQDHFGNFEEALEDDSISEHPERTVQGIIHLQKHEYSKVENTMFSTQGGVSAETATSWCKEKDAAANCSTSCAPDNLEEAENISYDPCGQGFSEDGVLTNENEKDASIITVDGGNVLSVLQDEASQEVAGTELQKTVSSCSQGEDNAPTEPEIDSNRSSPQQNAEALYEETETQMMKDDEVTEGENNWSQKAGEDPNDPSDRSSLGKNVQDHQDVAKEELHLQRDPTNEAVSMDDNDCSALNKHSYDNTIKTSPADAREPHFLHKLDEVLTVTDSKKANDFGSLDTISPFLGEVVAYGGTTSAIRASPHTEGKASEISFFGEGEEYKVESVGADDEELHEIAEFTEEAATQVAEEQQGEFEHPINEVAQLKSTYPAISDESNFDKTSELEMQDNVPNNLDDIHSSIICKFQAKEVKHFHVFTEKEILMQDVEANAFFDSTPEQTLGEALELMEDMPENVEMTANKSLEFTTLGQDVTAGDDQSCNLKLLSAVKTNPETKELSLWNEQFTHSSLRRKTSRTDLYQKTPEKVFDLNASKENAPSMKIEPVGNMTAPKTLGKRRPLEDLRNY